MLQLLLININIGDLLDQLSFLLHDTWRQVDLQLLWDQYAFGFTYDQVLRQLFSIGLIASIMLLLDVEVQTALASISLVAAFIRADLVALKHRHGLTDMDLPTTGSVPQSFHLAHVAIVKVLDAVDLGDKVASFLCRNLHLLEQVLVLNE